jgi:hypothetical protein
MQVISFVPVVPPANLVMIFPELLLQRSTIETGTAETPTKGVGRY